MHAPYEVPRFSVSGASIADADVDLIIIPIAQDNAAAAAARITTARSARTCNRRSSAASSAPKPNEIYVARTPASGWRAAADRVRRRRSTQRDQRRSAFAAWRRARRRSRDISAVPRIGWADLEPGAIAATRAHRNRGRRVRARQFRQRRAQEPRRRPVLHHAKA